MWVSDKWTDYELIDCSGGEKLERWGDHILVRPDPQVIWDTPRRHQGWKKPDAHYKTGAWKNHSVPASWRIGYGKLIFNVKLMNSKQTGIFPEQAENWDFIIKRVSAKKRGFKVLNLFAYTGAATLACSLAGAAVCHVDAAKGMVAWARENAAASGLAHRPIRWIVDDCRKFVEREIRRGNRYDAIIMDPPSYGRGSSGELWKLEDNLFDFVKLCAGVLSDKPDFVIINTYTTGLSSAVLTYISQTVFGKRFGGKSQSAELGLPVTESGLVLPCGATCRWTA
ncbi:MAG: SAM-dependent methyltransferase [Clostridiales bacterium]|jgi:23S rRNA (cytosine1962-C5)-methyltransferase|nr:SAM-dependent methyltransferase [Clostridiales bacterium]